MHAECWPHPRDDKLSDIGYQAPDVLFEFERIFFADSVTNPDFHGSVRHAPSDVAGKSCHTIAATEQASAQADSAVPGRVDDGS